MTTHMPDVGAIARNAAKIGACIRLINDTMQKAGGSQRDMITRRGPGLAIPYGTEKSESLCGASSFSRRAPVRRQALPASSRSSRR